MKSVVHRVVDSLQKENQEFQDKIAALTDAAEKKGAAAAASATRALRTHAKELEVEVRSLRKRLLEVRFLQRFWLHFVYPPGHRFWPTVLSMRT